MRDNEKETGSSAVQSSNVDSNGANESANVVDLHDVRPGKKSVQSLRSSIEGTIDGIQNKMNRFQKILASIRDHMRTL